MLEAFLPVRKQKKKAPIRKRAPLFFLFIHDEERNFIFPHHVMFIAGNLFYIFGIMEIAAFFFQTFIVLFDGLDLFTALDGLLADKVKVIGLFSKLVQRNDSNQDNDQSQPPKSQFLGTFQLFPFAFRHGDVSPRDSIQKRARYQSASGNHAKLFVDGVFESFASLESRNSSLLDFDGFAGARILAVASFA